MSSFFSSNGYPNNTIQLARERIENISQDTALQNNQEATNNQRIPLTLTYHPFNKNVKKIIYNNFHILIEDNNTKQIFNAPPLMAYRKDKNLKDMLVHTNLNSPEVPGTFPCNHHLCQICNHVNSSTFVTNHNRSFNIKCHFTCSTSCVIYCIICTRCSMLYIGETSRQINN